MPRSIRSYQRELATLREMIASMLWVQPTYNGSPSCAYCGEQQHLHKTHCKATKLVATWDLSSDEIRQRAVEKG
jgi:hypothetical protein